MRFSFRCSRDGPMKASSKKDLPVSQIRRFLEPGPIVLVSSAWRGHGRHVTWDPCVSWTLRLVDLASRGPCVPWPLRLVDPATLRRID